MSVAAAAAPSVRAPSHDGANTDGAVASCSSAHSGPSATARPATDDHACQIERCRARLAEMTAGGQQIGVSTADQVDGVVVNWICP